MSPEPESSAHVALERLFPLLLVVCGIFAYVNTFAVPFLFDDMDRLVHNRAVQLGEIRLHPRFLIYATFWLNHKLSGFQLADWHATNLAIHLGAGLLLYGVLRRTFGSAPLAARYGRAAAGLAATAAGFWLVHPLQTQSVTYLVQRSESLTGLFYLLTLYCVVRGAGTEGARARAWYGGAVLACMLGLGCKEIMVTAPVMVLLYDWVFLSDGSVRRLLRKRWLLHLAMAASWLWLLWLFRRTPAEYTSTSGGFAYGRVSPIAYAMTQFQVIPHYFRLALWPHPLCFDYAWLPVRGLREIWPQVLALSGVGLSVLWALVRMPPVGFAGMWFFVVLVPTSSIMPIADLAVEHRMYLPLASVVACGAVGGYELLGRMRLARLRLALAAAVCLVLIAATLRRNQVYRSEKGLWLDVVAKRSRNARAYCNVGSCLASDEGDFMGALPYFKQAVRISPEFGPAHNSLGRALIELGQFERGLTACRHALELGLPRREQARAHYNIGLGLERLNRREQAMAQYRRAIEVYPYMITAYARLGSVLAGSGRVREAEKFYRAALAKAPAAAGIRYSLANLLDADGRVEEAEHHLRAAIEANPRHAGAYNDLGVILARNGRLQASLLCFREAVRISPEYAEAHYNLGNALVRRGDRGAAVAAYERALDIEPGLARAHYNLGLMLTELGRFAEAVAHLDAVLDQEPANTNAAAYRARAARALQ